MKTYLKFGAFALAAVWLGFAALMAIYADDTATALIVLAVFALPVIGVPVIIRLLRRLRRQTAAGEWQAAGATFSRLPLWRKALAVLLAVLALGLTS